MTHTLRIEGFLTAITPYHLAHANVPGQVDDNGAPRVLRGGTAKIPCTMTYKMPVRIAADEGSGRAYIPTIPSTSLRGRIRRAAADLFKKRFIASSQMLDRKSYHVLQVLSFGAQGINRAGIRPADMTRAANDLYAGVFGGGPALWPSTLVTPDALAITRETVELGLLPATAAATAVGAPAAYECTFAHPFVSRDDLLQFLDPMAPQVIENYAETFMAWQELVQENQAVRSQGRKDAAADAKARKAAKAAKSAEPSITAEVTDAGEATAKPAEKTEKAKKISIVGQAAVEAVIPGVSFGFEMTVRGSAAQCGMIVAALQDVFGSDKGLGGFVRNGYGRFAAHLSMKLDNEQSTLLIADGRGRSELTSPAATALRDAFESELSTYTAEQFKAAYLLMQSDEGKS